MASRSDPITVKHETWKQRGYGLYDMHYPVELGMVLSGSMRRRVEGHAYTVAAGQIWLQSIWEAHQTEVLSTPLELIVVHVLPESLRELSFTETPGMHWLSLWMQPIEARIGATPQEAAKVEACFRALAQANNEAIHSKLMRRAHLLQLLAELSEGVALSQVAADGGSALTPALDALFESQGRIDLASAASSCGMSISTFKRNFRAQMQTGYAAFALRYRIHGVCQDLIRSQEPIKRIAVEWGFVDSSHLHRHFKEIIHCTPSEYRTAALSQLAHSGGSDTNSPARPESIT